MRTLAPPPRLLNCYIRKPIPPPQPYKPTFGAKALGACSCGRAVRWSAWSGLMPMPGLDPE